ncbi:hypothetical protein HII12_002246 [Brettanomyces bruxellensis]|uniref:Chitobiosyldiphosphodolichol beta-mannosyltransferase n=1 Tax=Dekkera bruxellensis TaxID=5007 RepID=A0A8H6BJV1_DEKBR|nr:hypothetical protein HII12_002246 [Brettanomyces bruxellensis]
MRDLTEIEAAFAGVNWRPHLIRIAIVWVIIPFFFYYFVASLTYWLGIRRKRLRLSGKDADEAVVIVLGDLGRSPRITYQARSLVEHGFLVNVCGYIESALPSFLYDEDIELNEISVIRNTRHLPYALFAASKAISQIFELVGVLTRVITDRTKYVLIQNPPCFPLLAILVLLKLTICPHIKLVIDWHNFNYTILNLRYQNERHPLVKFLKAYERCLGAKYTDLNLTVTDAMRKFLIGKFGFPSKKVITLHDRPAEKFRPLSGRAEFRDIQANHAEIFAGTKFDSTKDKILITATSFTADEDFNVLVDGLIALDDLLEEEKAKPKVLMIVTGKGPLKNAFLKRTAAHNWSHVTIKSVWLSDEEYPKVLRIADLGISLHYSSSGLDLPMKIVDLFGSGVPVLSMGYPVIHELVHEGQNGVCMSDNKSGEEMGQKLNRILFCEPEVMGKLKSGAVHESSVKWNDEWEAKLGQIMRH